MLTLAACSGRQPPRPVGEEARPVYHYVSAGETLYGIGLRYGVPYQEIARVNRLADPSRIEIGQRLLLPRAAREKEAVGAPDKKHASPVAAAKRAEQEKAPPFHWPADGTLTSRFGPRDGGVHEGIDIAAPWGSAVRAAADGEVVYSGTLPGYGKVLILRHAGGYATVYAHNQRNKAKQGQKVRRGDFIGTVGRTGRTLGANLHFEIRKNNLARDPLLYLPAAAAGDGPQRQVLQVEGTR